MASPTLGYVDAQAKRIVEAWTADKAFDAADQLCLHLEDRFQVSAIEVVSAKDNGAFLVLTLRTDQWSEPREFALLSNGSLTW